MTALLIDIGNARVKWARHEAGPLARVDDAVHDGDARALTRAVRGDLASGATAIVVANVAGPAMAAALTEAASVAGAVRPRFIASTSSACGVRNAYGNPQRLGVDRWAAMIAGHALSQARRAGSPSCIIDAGTAVTFDAVRGDGQHLGGLILAGPRLQVEALWARTSDIGAVTAETRFPGAGLDLLGRSTEAAVSRGAWLAIAGALTRACATVGQALGVTPVTYLCGGYAAPLRDWLEFPVQVREHLVLEGLAAIADAEAAK